MTLLNSSDSGPNSQIDCSFTKLFQCMSIAYRQKLTSPKWNRFLGMKLRWKDKIRLNNVIWRCWHMQFIKVQEQGCFSILKLLTFLQGPSEVGLCLRQPPGH